MLENEQGNWNGFEDEGRGTRDEDELNPQLATCTMFFNPKSAIRNLKLKGLKPFLSKLDAIPAFAIENPDKIRWLDVLGNFE